MEQSYISYYSIYKLKIYFFEVNLRTLDVKYALSDFAADNILQPYIQIHYQIVQFSINRGILKHYHDRAPRT